MPGLARRAIDEWAYHAGVKLNFIRPGKPIENAYAESFNGRLRDESLNTNWIMNLKHAFQDLMRGSVKRCTWAKGFLSLFAGATRVERKGVLLLQWLIQSESLELELDISRC
jgi:transposase InsO family protein